LTSTTTPSTTAHKRKADEADNYLSPAEEPPLKKKTQLASANKLPVTPATNADADKMDSDDEFNSSMSGDDFDDQDSDLGLEDGTYAVIFTTVFY